MLVANKHPCFKCAFAFPIKYLPKFHLWLSVWRFAHSNRQTFSIIILEANNSALNKNAKTHSQIYKSSTMVPLLTFLTHYHMASSLSHWKSSWFYNLTHLPTEIGFIFFFTLLGFKTSSHCIQQDGNFLLCVSWNKLGYHALPY